jgi:hypothetical protein
VLVIALLWSINERIVGRKGYEMPDPSRDWIPDLLWLNELDAQQARERKRANMGLEEDD